MENGERQAPEPVSENGERQAPEPVLENGERQALEPVPENGERQASEPVPENSGKIRVSSLGKTWILDLDGTIVKHNGYKLDGEDSFLLGAKEFLDSIPDTDMVIFITSRKDVKRDGEEKSDKEKTEEFLKKHNIRYDAVIYNAPYGERILINDSKPSGLPMAYALRPKRDEFFKESFEVDESF